MPDTSAARAGRSRSRRRGRILTLVPALLMLAPDVRAGDWELAQDQDGIAVYTRATESSEYLAFRGVVTVPQSVDEVAAVLEDTEGYPRWYARCQEARVVKRQPPDWRIVHMKIDLPFPVSDRDAVVRVSREAAEPGHRVFRMSTAADALPEQPGFVRMARVEGSWTLEPDPAGGTRIVLEQSNDPGGTLPSWLSNLLVTDQPASTLAGLRRTLEEPSASSR